MKPLAAGTVFAERYEILSSAGHGGMGFVYRARHLGLAKDVALKVLGPTRTRDYETRFAREARAIARLDHPGCVRVLDHGRVDGAQYIAMELLEGDTLGTAMQNGPFSTERALDIARQLLFALAHAHEHGVIHRDVKPENVMLVKGGKRPRVMERRSPASGPECAVLIDFGLACMRDEQPLTGAGMCVGSPSYLAPERLLGQPYDLRTDLYAVGVVLYEMVAGQKPFAGATVEQTMKLAIHRPPRPLRALRRDIPSALDRVIRRALAKDPRKRFQDAEEMLLALNDVPAESEIAARLVESQREAERDEAAATMVAVQLYRPSLLSRMWTWLRYGGWRWRTGRRWGNEEAPATSGSWRF